MKVIISTTTYPKRFERFSKNFESILNQTLFDFAGGKNEVRVVVNVDDNISEEDTKRYDEFLKTVVDRGYDAILRKRPAKWRSANKYLFTEQEYPDLPIILVDDDIYYKKTLLEHLYETWLIDPSLIVCEEANPLMFGKNSLNIINGVVFKIGYDGFDKYLTNCCLMPPHAVDGTDVYNWEAFNQLCSCTHDELWFWIHTTIKGVNVRVLNDLFTFCGEGNTAPDETALCNTNQPLWNEYTNRINAHYLGPISKSVCTHYTTFHVNNDSFWTILLGLRRIEKVFDYPYKLRFRCDKDISPTIFITLLFHLGRAKFTNAVVEVEGMDDVFCDIDRLDFQEIFKKRMSPTGQFEPVNIKDYMNGKK